MCLEKNIVIELKVGEVGQRKTPLVREWQSRTPVVWPLAQLQGALWMQNQTWTYRELWQGKKPGKKKQSALCAKVQAYQVEASSNSHWTIFSLVIYSSGRVELQEESASSVAVVGRGDPKEQYFRAIVKWLYAAANMLCILTDKLHKLKASVWKYNGLIQYILL